MKLRKDQRYTLYCMMWYELENYDGSTYNGMHDGFCYGFYEVFDLQDSQRGFSGIISELFPEIESKKPKKMYNSDIGLWFKPNRDSKYGVNKRIELIKKCIKETENF